MLGMALDGFQCRGSQDAVLSTLNTAIFGYDNGVTMCVTVALYILEHSTYFSSICPFGFYCSTLRISSRSTSRDLDTTSCTMLYIQLPTGRGPPLLTLVLRLS